MQCPSCNSDLEVDEQVDTSVIEPEIVHENFKCSNDDCNKHFVIEFHPVDITEIDYVDPED
jgi:hypothetical protein